MLLGCGEGALSTSNPGTPPPHGGELLALSDGRGFVEVVKKEASPGAGATTSELAFYFYKTPYTPFSPAPSSASLMLDRKKVDLVPQGDALVTPPGPLLFAKGRDVEGVLSVDLAGNAVKIPLGVR
jgi:hypothetical protein